MLETPDVILRYRPLIEAPVTIRTGGRPTGRAGQSAGKAGRTDRVSVDRNPQRPYAEHGSSREEMVRPPWRHGEPGGTETTWPPGGREPLGGNRCVGPYPPWA